MTKPGNERLNELQLIACLESAIIASINDRKENKSKGIIIDNLRDLNKSELDTSGQITNATDSKTKKTIFIPKGLRSLIPQFKHLSEFSKKNNAPRQMLTNIQQIAHERLNKRVIRSKSNKTGTELYNALVGLEHSQQTFGMQISIADDQLQAFKEKIGVATTSTPAAIHHTLSRALQPFLSMPSKSGRSTFFMPKASKQPSIPKIVENFLLCVKAIADDETKNDFRKFAEQQIILNDFYTLVNNIDHKTAESMATHVQRELGLVIDSKHPHPLLNHAALGVSVTLDTMDRSIPETGRERWDGKTTKFDLDDSHLTAELTKMAGADSAIKLLKLDVPSHTARLDESRVTTPRGPAR